MVKAVWWDRAESARQGTMCGSRKCGWSPVAAARLCGVLGVSRLPPTSPGGSSPHLLASCPRGSQSWWPQDAQWFSGTLPFQLPALCQGVKQQTRVTAVPALLLVFPTKVVFCTGASPGAVQLCTSRHLPMVSSLNNVILPEPAIWSPSLRKPLV